MRIISVFDNADSTARDGLEKAMRFLEDNDLSALRPGSVQAIDGDTVFVQVQEYETRPESVLDFETHNVYYDLHYILSGTEYICCAHRKGMTPKTAYDHDNDITFYEDPIHYKRLSVKTGDAVFIAPTEAHKPRCTVDTPQRVRKIVVKIKAGEQTAIN
jgi:YhcH/YjgK/YiaL family protein